MGILFHKARVRNAVGAAAGPISPHTNLPAAAHRFVDADNGKPLVGAGDRKRTSVHKVGPFGLEQQRGIPLMITAL